MSSGKFLRNLKKKHVAKRYPNDKDESPTYGYKLSNKFWNDADEQGNLSVNDCDCVRSDACSIAVHPNAKSYYHIAELDLQSLNHALPQNPFVAQYIPVENNSCHFELLPADGATLSLLALQTLMDDPFPEGKMPTASPDIQEAYTARSRYQRILAIRKWVRNRDGVLTQPAP